MIPKLVHNIWIQGYNNLPENLKTSYNNIKELNPEWEFIFWDENMIIDLLKIPKHLQGLSKYRKFTWIIKYSSIKK